MQLQHLAEIQIGQDLVAALQALERQRFLAPEALAGLEQNPAWFLLPLLEKEDWQVRAKALITIGRVGDQTLAGPLLAWLKAAPLPCWQLQAMDAWFQLPIDRSIKEQTALVLLDWAKEPIAIRGVLWLLAQIGGVDVAYRLAEFITSSAALVIRDEFLADCWFRVSGGITPKQFNAIAEKYPNLSSWLKYRRWEGATAYGLYPSPDYLWRLAEASGVSQAQFKNLYFKARNKKEKLSSNRK